MASAEDAIQGTIVDFVRLMAPHVRIIAVPNAARRTGQGRAANGVPGLTPGVPDLIVILPAGRTLWWEVKTPKGRLDPEQIAFHADLVGLDHHVTTVRSVEDVRAELARVGVETREAASHPSRSPPCSRPTISPAQRSSPGAPPASPASRPASSRTRSAASSA